MAAKKQIKQLFENGGKNFTFENFGLEEFLTLKPNYGYMLDLLITDYEKSKELPHKEAVKYRTELKEDAILYLAKVTDVTITALKKQNKI